jgi:hypothetical protein
LNLVFADIAHETLGVKILVQFEDDVVHIVCLFVFAICVCVCERSAQETTDFKMRSNVVTNWVRTLATPLRALHCFCSLDTKGKMKMGNEFLVLVLVWGAVQFLLFGLVQQ